MNRKIKLIWDFWGEDSLKTAEHHAVHLKDFTDRTNIKLINHGVEEVQPGQHIAFMVVEESNMLTVRDSLRPKRGQWLEEENI